jgi:hypothetical protein
VAGRRIGIFEDPVITQATPEELTDAKERKSAYQKAMPLPPGTYKVDVIVRDVTSGATGIRHVGFTVPKYDPQKLSTSTLVLAAKLENLQSAGSGPIWRWSNEGHSNVWASSRRGDPVGVLFRSGAGIDQSDLATLG